MRKPSLSYEMISGLTTAQLKQLIKKEGNLANRRLNELRKKGYYRDNTVIAQKWDAFLSENKNATKAKNFSVNTNKKRSELIKQYKNIRDFLSNPTTVMETKRTLKKQAERLNVSVDVARQALKLYGNSGMQEIVGNSDLLQSYIAKMADNGFNGDEINAALNALEQSTTSQEQIQRLIYDELQQPYLI